MGSSISSRPGQSPTWRRTLCEDMLVSPANGESDVRPRRHPFRSRRAGKALRECRAMKTMARLLPILLTFALVCFALVQPAQAVVPPPDGGYPGGNTAEGTGALLTLGPNGFNNTAIGFLSLRNNTQGDANTAVGAGALFSNRGEGQNTATGAGALFNNFGANNTANGAFALYTNGLGSGNTAMGSTALYSNRTAFANTAIGYGALFNNTGEDFALGAGNTAIGLEALYNNT